MSSPVCQWVWSVLTAFLDGELKPSTAAAVRRHLAHCAACRKHAEQLQEAWNLLGELPTLHIREGFTERMMVRIVEEKELEAIEGRLRWGRRIREALTAASGLAAGLVLGLVLYTWTGLVDEPNSPIEREVSRSVAFLEDADLLDEMAVIQAMDEAQGEQRPVGDGV